MRIFHLMREMLATEKERVWFRPAPGQMLKGVCLGPSEFGNYVRMKVGEEIILADPMDCDPSPNQASE